MSRPSARTGLSTLRRGLRELLAVRWVRWSAIALLLALAVRLALVTLLGLALDAAARPYDLEVRWRGLSLSILGGRGSVRQLEVLPLAREGDENEEEPEPLVDVEYAVFDLQVLPLLTGDLRIRRAEVDGVDARLERAEDGTWNLERHVDFEALLAALESSEPEEEDDDDDDEPDPLELEPPLAIESLRFQHARLRVVDRAVEPPLDVLLESSLRLSNLRDPVRPTRFSATTTARTATGALLDGATLDGTARWEGEELALEVRSRLGGLHPRRVARYLRALGIEPDCDTLDAGFRAEARLSVLEGEEGAPAPRGVRLELVLEDAQLEADGTEELALDSLTLAASELSGERARLGSVVARGLRAAPAVTASGAFRAAGFLLGGGPSSTAGEGASGGSGGSGGWAASLGELLALGTPERAPAAVARFLHPTAQHYPWSVDLLALEEAAFVLTDASTDPPAALGLAVDHLELEGLTHDDGAPPARLTAAGSLPGLAESWSAEGTLAPTAPARELDLAARVAGLGLAGANPYLARAGLERASDGGKLELRLHGTAETGPDGVTRAALEVDEVALVEQGGADPLFGARRIALRELVVDPAQRLLRLGELEVEGSRLALGRDPTGRFLALGLRTLVGGAEAAPAAPGRATGTAPAGNPAGGTDAGSDEERDEDPEVEPARVELGRLAWTDSAVAFEDAVFDPPRSLRVGDLRAELRDLVLGGRATDAEPEPARLTARLSAEGLADALVLEGEVRSRPGAVDLAADLALRGEGLSGEELDRYLAPLGLVTTLRDGRAALEVDARLRESGGWRVDLELAGGSLTDGDVELLGLDALHIEDARVGAAGVRVERLSIEGPRARVVRAADGGLEAAGLRVVPAPSGNGPGARSQPSAAGPNGEEPAPPPTLALPPVSLGRLGLADARLLLRDETADPPLELELVADALGRDLGTRGDEGTLEAHLAVPGVLEELVVRSTLTAAGPRVVLSAEADARRLRPGPLAALLPPGLTSAGEVDLSGRFTAELALEEGIVSAALSADGLACVGADGTRWAELDTARIERLELDLGSGAVRVGPVTSEGLRAEVVRGREEVRALGLVLAAAPTPPDGENGSDDGDPPVDATAGDVEGASAAKTPPAAVVLPPLELTGPVAFELASLRVRDATAPNSRPLEASARFELAGPAVLLDDDPRDLPALEWKAEGSLAGLVGAWRLSGTALPFAEEPRFTLEAAAEGVRTLGLVELVPQLGELVAGTLEDGRASLSAETTLRVRRARPNELGLARGFGAELRVEDVRFEDGNGEVLAGLDELLVEVEKIDPSRGFVHVAELHLETPRARLRRDADGIHALGLVAALPPGTEASSDAAEDATEPSAEEATAGSAQGDEGDAGGEVRVDLVTLTGLDVRVEDTSVEPPLELVLDRLDVEVARLTTRMLAEPRQAAYSAYLGAAAATEDARPLFAEASVAGRAGLFPAPTGYAQLVLEGLELTQLAGYAAAAGVTVEDGALDASARLRLLGDRGATIGADLAFTDLSLEEGEDGPVRSALGLPMPLGTALFLVATPGGGHRFSFGVSVPASGLSMGGIATAAVGALAEVFTSAVLGAPFRVLGSLVPGGGGEVPPQIVEVEYAPGATELAPAERDRLFRLALRLDADPALRALVRHELGEADVERAERRANPGEAEALELVAGLRRRRTALWTRAEERGREARALHAIGASEAREAGAELGELQAELAGVEDALDRVLETLRADSERHRKKRTRRAVREMADVRLAEAEALLRTALGRSDAEQVDVRPPKREVVHEGAGRLVIELRR